MKFPVAVVLAFMASAYAQTSAAPSGSSTGSSTANPFKIAASGFSATAGSTAQLSWTPTTSGTVSLILRSGSSNNLNAGTPIAQNIPNSGSYSWSVPSSVTRGSDYTVEIVAASGETNYSPYFVIESTNTVASVTNPSSSATVTVTSTGTKTGTSSSGSVTSSGTATSSGTTVTSSSSSGSVTSRTTTSSSASGAGFQSTTTTSPTGAAPRATAAAGFMGAVAIAALAL